MSQPLKQCAHCGEPGSGTNDAAWCVKCYPTDSWVPTEVWNRRTPSPATKAMLEYWRAGLQAFDSMHPDVDQIVRDFLAEWTD